MKSYDFAYIVGGLAAGFIIGMVLIGTNDNLRGGIFGTAADDEPEEVLYYQVPFAEARAWIEGLNEEVEETDINDVEGLTSASDFGAYYTEKQGSIQELLGEVYSVFNEDGKEVSVCIALNNDPYSTTGPLLYLYLEVPESMKEKVPTDWEAQPNPVEESMLWSTECYKATE